MNKKSSDTIVHLPEPLLVIVLLAVIFEPADTYRLECDSAAGIYHTSNTPHAPTRIPYELVLAV